jgi:hypothetical protein
VSPPPTQQLDDEQDRIRRRVFGDAYADTKAAQRKRFHDSGMVVGCRDDELVEGVEARHGPDVAHNLRAYLDHRQQGLPKPPSDARRRGYNASVGTSRRRNRQSHATHAGHRRTQATRAGPDDPDPEPAPPEFRWPSRGAFDALMRSNRGIGG